MCAHVCDIIRYIGAATQQEVDVTDKKIAKWGKPMYVLPSARWCCCRSKRKEVEGIEFRCRKRKVEGKRKKGRKGKKRSL